MYAIGNITVDNAAIANAVWANSTRTLTNYGTGSGATAKTYTVTDGTNPIPDVTVWVTTDSAGLNSVASGKTNDLGQVVFYLDSGTTYYIWRAKTGWNFVNPDVEVA
jgi:hypothetical protein